MSVYAKDDLSKRTKGLQQRARSRQVRRVASYRSSSSSGSKSSKSRHVKSVRQILNEERKKRNDRDDFEKDFPDCPLSHEDVISKEKSWIHLKERLLKQCSEANVNRIYAYRRRTDNIVSSIMLHYVTRMYIHTRLNTILLALQRRRELEKD